MKQKQSHSSTRGFTLIELLVSIGIIGLLIGILLPALSGARGSALQTVALSNVRSVGTQFEQYASDNKNYPHLGLGVVPEILKNAGGGYEPTGNELIFEWYPGGVIIATTDYFEHSWMWPAIVAPHSEWPNYWETWVSPNADQELPTMDDFGMDAELEQRDQISIRYSNSFVTRPSYWSGEQDQVDQSLFKATRPQDVQFASSKVMLWDDDLAYLSQRNPPERIEGLLDAKTPMAFADGHSEVLLPSDASEAVLNVANGQTAKLHNTKDGVRGRDF